MADIIAMFSRWAMSGLSQMLSRVSSSSDGSASSSMESIRHSAMGDFQRIMRMLPRIEAVLEDAEEREVLDRYVNLWLSELRVLAYDIDEVVDEYEYEVLRVRIETRAAEESYCYDKPKGSYDDHDDGDEQGEGRNMLASSSSQVPAISDGMAQKLREIRERFDEIESDRKALRLREEEAPRRTVTPRVTQLTSHLVEESSIFGREGDKKKIMDQLLSGSESSNNNSCSNKITVISLVGMGGVGKTTLAQLIYNDPKISEYFNHRAWIYVSEDFDLMRLTRDIYESIFEKRCENNTSFDRLQSSIKKGLEKFKRTFLVLDDVWNEKRGLWESLQLPFHSAGIVNILITTRSKKVADIMTTTKSFDLDSLSIEAGCRLFKKCASCDDDRLMKIGRQIVEKCNRLPLAVKLLGSDLRFERDEDKWTSILESELWDLKPVRNEILPSLILSYQRLPIHLKACIKHCSMFPKNRIPNKNRLVWFWMAQGYIQPNAANKTMEEIGGEYFDELLERSLLQPTKSKHFFKLHDLIFDMIVFILREEFIALKLGDGEQNKTIPNNVRHLVLHDERTHYGAQKEIPAYPSISKHLTLRSIVYHGRSMFYDFQFPNSICLRTLHLNFEKYDRNMLELLGSIASLKHLRYLYIGMGFLGYQSCEKDALSGIFNSFCRVYHLQVLDLSDCEQRFKLQASINNLINLQHLILPHHSPITCGVSKLVNLQTLKHVVVEEESNECGGLSEIEDLANLTGCCRISKLCNAINVESVKKASINKKQHIGSLCLCWLGAVDSGVSFDVDISFDDNDIPKKQGSRELAEAILEALRPHNSLKAFELYDYPGIRFPILWLDDPSSYSKLQDLKLHNCHEWDGSCGVLDRDLPCLQKISIKNCGELEQLKIAQSSSLRVLLVQNCPKLSALRGLCNLMTLEKLEIRKCYNLMISAEERLPSKLHSVCFKDCWKLTLKTGLKHLHSLKELKLKRCLKLQLSLDEQLLTSPDVVNVTDCLGLMEWCQIYGFKYIQKVFKIEELTIRHNNDFEFHHESGAASLKSLHIYNYYEKDFIEDEWIPCNLNTLILRSCPWLRFLPRYRNLFTLRQLKIWNCKDLEYLPGLQLMESLEKLDIINCYDLKMSLVERLPSKLQYLLISNCPSLMALPGLQHLLCLRDLKLYECGELTLLPPEQLPFMQQVRLEIFNCPKLEEWCRSYNLSYNNEETHKALIARSNQQIMEDSVLSEDLCIWDYDEAILETENWPTFQLSRFYVCSCVHLKSITFGDNFGSLTQLKICNCSHLEELYGLCNLVFVSDIDIINCLNLCSLWPPESLRSFLKRILSDPLTKSQSSTHRCFYKISKCPKLYLDDGFKQYMNRNDVFEIHACPQLQEWCQKYGFSYFQDSSPDTSNEYYSPEFTQLQAELQAYFEIPIQTEVQAHDEVEDSGRCLADVSDVYHPPKCTQLWAQLQAYFETKFQTKVQAHVEVEVNVLITHLMKTIPRWWRRTGRNKGKEPMHVSDEEE